MSVTRERVAFDWTSFMVLFKHGKWTLLESAFRNVLYLSVIANIVLLGSEYASAWSVFNTIRYACCCCRRKETHVA